MENLKKVSRAQWYLFALLIGIAFLMQNCQDDDAVIYEENQTETELNAKPPVSGKVDVCRFNERKGTYSVVSLIAKFVPSKLLPGDVILDADGDGYVKVNSCTVTGLGIDCDDTNAAITSITYYADADGDGFGDPNATTITACSLPPGYAENNLDCDDSNDNINPNADEICADGIDNNCDGIIDPCTAIPDNNFEEALNNLGIDNDGYNNFVLTANINTLTYLNVSSSGISDLTGIGGFADLETLHCWGNNLTSLDLSQNTELITLVCANNYLASIDVSNSANLDLVDCNSNLLETLDLSANTALTYLACTENLLKVLDMSANTALLDLQCNLNSLESLNISGCPLEYLYCSDNQLLSLDVSSHTALIGLYCGNNDFSSFNISSNTALQEFDCYGNDLLTSLDVSANINLTRLYCYSNPSLTCIKVNADQLATPPANWWKDWDTVYALDCPS